MHINWLGADQGQGYWSTISILWQFDWNLQLMIKKLLTRPPELSPLLDLQLPGTTWALWSSPTSSRWSSCATPTAGLASSSGAVGPSGRPPRLRLRASSLREKWVPDKKINLFWSYQTGHNIASAASGKKKIISKLDINYSHSDSVGWCQPALPSRLRKYLCNFR